MSVTTGAGQFHVLMWHSRCDFLCSVFMATGYCLATYNAEWMWLFRWFYSWGGNKNGTIGLRDQKWKDVICTLSFSFLFILFAITVKPKVLHNATVKILAQGLQGDPDKAGQVACSQFIYLFFGVVFNSSHTNPRACSAVEAKCWICFLLWAKAIDLMWSKKKHHLRLDPSTNSKCAAKCKRLPLFATHRGGDPLHELGARYGWSNLW